MLKMELGLHMDLGKENSTRKDLRKTHSIQKLVTFTELKVFFFRNE